MALVGEYLTVKQSARFLGVAENTLRNWDMAGAVPVRRNPKKKYAHQPAFGRVRQ